MTCDTITVQLQYYDSDFSVIFHIYLLKLSLLSVQVKQHESHQNCRAESFSGDGIDFHTY